MTALTAILENILLYYLYFPIFSKYAVNAVIAVKNEILLIFLTVSIIFLPTAAVIYSNQHLPRVSGEIFLQTS